MNDQQLLRYSRQILLPDIDIEGQQALLGARVMIIGLGGLGSPVASYLAAAGVGELLLVDDDEVDLSNLQRQIVHTTERIGMTKVESARLAIAALNPEIKVTALAERLTGESLQKALSGVDLLVDCCDNFATRFELNRACFNAGIPLVSGAAIRMEGQISVYDPRQADSPCYQCLYTEGDDEGLSCSDSGVLAPLVGVIGSMQALEAIKVITGVGRSLVGRLLLFDAKQMEWRSLKLKKDPQCPVCSTKVQE